MKKLMLLALLGMFVPQLDALRGYTSAQRSRIRHARTQAQITGYVSPEAWVNDELQMSWEQYLGIAQPSINPATLPPPIIATPGVGMGTVSSLRKLGGLADLKEQAYLAYDAYKDGNPAFRKIARGKLMDYAEKLLSNDSYIKNMSEADFDDLMEKVRDTADRGDRTAVDLMNKRLSLTS